MAHVNQFTYIGAGLIHVKCHKFKSWNFSVGSTLPLMQSLMHVNVPP